MRRRAYWITAMLLLAAVGCSGGGMTDVQGTVNLDGQPLERGRIEFQPAAGDTGPLAAAEITDGKYSVSVMTGKKIVRITGGKVVGTRPFTEAPGSPTIEDIQSLVGEQYNTKSKLTCEITTGNDTYDFNLTTTP